MAGNVRHIEILEQRHWGSIRLVPFQLAPCSHFFSRVVCLVILERLATHDRSVFVSQQPP